MEKYKLIEEKYLENEQANALVFEHNKTLAKVFVMSNDDDNKVFGIGFRTPPKNSNGVCHIIEHAVLNGSKKYRTKEPFMDMIKGSLNTFLNAMTFSDKTIYPVASRNDKDFRNLTDVYLDAVFNPKVKEEEKIFRQEGWRYNLEDDKLTYKGVVYNEMRGAMSSLESQVYKNIYAELQPDTIYAHNSGGDPYVIPSLTYGDFLDYYNEFYHPTNSYIFLYGNMDYEEYLEYIDSEYLSNYEHRTVDSKLEKQTRFEGTRFAVNYLNTAKEVTPKESFITYSTLLGDGSDSITRILSDLVSSALIDNESSSLRQRLLASGLLDVIFSASQNTVETSFSLVAKNIDAENRDEFVEIIEDEFRKIVDEGIDKELFLAELNNYKFDIREKGDRSTKGIAYFINAFDSWLYDKSPIEAIDIESDIKYIEENLSNGLIESFIATNILNSNHKSIVTHIPKLGMNAQRDKDVENALEEKKNNLSEREKEELNQFRLDMADFQNRENTEEEKATLPMLTKEDVNTEIASIDREVIKKENYEILKHNLPTSGVDYLQLAFSIDDLSNPEDIMYLNLLTSVLGGMDTKSYNYSDLNKKILLSTGGINLSISQFPVKDSEEIRRKLVVSTKLFTENISEAKDMILEVLKNTKFDNTSRITEILLEIKAAHEIGLLQRAHAIMMNRSQSNHIEFNKYNEYLGGIDYILFIKKLVDLDVNEVAAKLKAIYASVFNRKDLIVNIGSTFQNEILLSEIESLAESFDTKEFSDSTFEFSPSRKSEGFKTSADVNYVSLGNKLNVEYNSQFMVLLSNFISNEYLYSEIRAKGGAYGAGVTASKLNGFTTYSYRDPNLKNTIEVYKNIPNFLEESNVTDDDLNPFIIGAVGRIDPPLTERMKSSVDLSRYISGYEVEDIEKDIENALNTTVESMKSQVVNLKETIDSASLAVLGNTEVIEENKDLFDEIIEL